MYISAVTQKCVKLEFVCIWKTVCVCEGTRFILKCVPQYRGALHHIVPDRQSAGLNTKQQEAPLHTAPIQPYRTQ